MTVVLKVGGASTGGGAEAIAAAAGGEFRALVTIDELYPERPDRG